MFVEVESVESEDLVVDTKYAIISTFNIDIYLTTTIECSEWGSPIYSNLKEHSGIENRNTYNKLLTIKDKDKEKGPDYFIYFAFVPQKEKIQQAMEKRAFDKILKRLINDDFIW
jgi:hypothetical protein